MRQRRSTLVSKSLAVLVVTACGISAAAVHWLEVLTISGESMSPGLHPGQQVVILRMKETAADNLGGRQIRRSDLLVVNAPESSRLVIKRVLGLPGDSIRISGGNLVINGRTIGEPYANYSAPALKEHDFWPSVPLRYKDPQVVEVPDGAVFLLGDHRDKSLDSRHWGSMPLSSIYGKELFALP